MVDADGVEDGDQGKNRRPRDHGRDYAGESIYPETAAIRALVAGWSEGRLHVGMDLHCPWIRGEWNDVVYQVGAEDAGAWREQGRFGRMLQAENAGPVPYRADGNLPFGQAWNTGGNYEAGKSFARWVGEQEGVRLVTSFELPHATAGGTEVTQQTTRHFGQALAPALRRDVPESP